MSEDTLLRLSWNKRNEFNLSQAFRSLRENSDFFDISLGCTDGRSLRAHRVIVSAYSGVFKEMLRQHPNTSDPFIYLKGVSFYELKTMLDFMYCGEVNIAQSNLDSFLGIAVDLKIKGLTNTEMKEELKANFDGNKQVAAGSVPKPVGNIKVRRDLSAFSTSNEGTTQNQLRMKSSFSKLPNYTEMLQKNMDKMKTFQSSLQQTKRKPSDDNNVISETKSAKIQYIVEDPLQSSSLTNYESDKSEQSSILRELLAEQDNATSTDQENDVLGHLERENEKLGFMESAHKVLKIGNQTRKYSFCKLCSKEVRTDHVKQHIKIKHPETASLKTEASDDNDENNNDDYLFKRETQDMTKFDTGNMLESNETYSKEPSMYDGDNNTNIGLESGGSETTGTPTNSTETTSLDKDYMENVSNGVVQHKIIRIDNRKRKYYECGLCSKELRQDRMGEHMAKKHADNDV